MESLGKLFETDKLVSLAINIIINCIFFYLNKRKIDVLEEQNLILMDRVNNLEKNLSNLINFINGGQPQQNQTPLQKTQTSIRQPNIIPPQSPIKTQIQRPNITPPQTQIITNQNIQLQQNSIPNTKNATSGLQKSLKVNIEPETSSMLDQILEEEEEKERLLNENIQEGNPQEGNPQEDTQEEIIDVGDPDDSNLISPSTTTLTGLENPDKKKSYAGMEIDN